MFQAWPGPCSKLGSSPSCEEIGPISSRVSLGWWTSWIRWQWTASCKNTKIWIGESWSTAGEFSCKTPSSLPRRTSGQKERRSLGSKVLGRLCTVLAKAGMGCFLPKATGEKLLFTCFCQLHTPYDILKSINSFYLLSFIQFSIYMLSSALICHYSPVFNGVLFIT